jgi:hypothetical protein
MTTFDDAGPPPDAAARLAAHYAAQLVAAAGSSLLAADPHHHHISTTLEDGALVGAALQDGRRVRLELATLTLRVGDAQLAVRGQTPAQALGWLSTTLGEALQFPTWDLPNGPAAAHPPLQATDAGLSRVAAWFTATGEALERFSPGRGQASAVRIWPHHFDMATLVVLRDVPGDPEAMTSIGIGMTPGDGGIPRAYLYVTPWPYPEVRATPALPAGRWQTEGWYGAVLEAPDITDAATVQGFLRAAFDRLSAELG